MCREGVAKIGDVGLMRAQVRISFFPWPFVISSSQKHRDADFVCACEQGSLHRCSASLGLCRLSASAVSLVALHSALL